MQLEDVVKPLDKMSDEELLAHLREVRHRRDTVRTASATRAGKAKGKAASKKLTGLANVMNAMSDEEREQLIAQLTGDTSE